MTLFEQMGGTYRQLGDYLIPNLMLSVEEYPIGKYGLLRQHYIKNHRKVFYSILLTSGKLNEHLREIDEAAFNRMELLIKPMAEREGVTERLKAENQILWVGSMNNILDRVDEIIREELVYA